jgi:hypothetical protein
LRPFYFARHGEIDYDMASIVRSELKMSIDIRLARQLFEVRPQKKLESREKIRKEALETGRAVAPSIIRHSQIRYFLGEAYARPT